MKRPQPRVKWNPVKMQYEVWAARLVRAPGGGVGTSWAYVAGYHTEESAKRYAEHVAEQQAERDRQREVA